MAKKAVIFDRKTTRANALASEDNDRIFFPTDDTSIIVGKKEYGVGGKADSALSATSENPVQNKVINSALDDKVGDMVFANGTVTFYADKAHSKVIGSFILGQVSYLVSMHANKDSVFYGLASHDKEYFSVSPTSESSAFGSQSPFLEDYTVTIDYSTDNGSTYKSFVIGGYCASGQTYSVDVRSLLTTSGVLIRVKVQGNASKAMIQQEFKGYLTSMSITAPNFNWWTAILEGSDMILGSYVIAGNLNKTLHLRISGNGYEREYTQNLGTQTYITTPYYFRGKEQGMAFPSTGVYKIETWLESSSIISDVVTHYVMFVSNADKATAKLVTVNDVSPSAMNFASNRLVSYALYNGGSSTSGVGVSIRALVDGGVQTVFSQSLSGITTEKEMQLTQEIALETEDADGKIMVSLTNGNTITNELLLDNSSSFPIVGGATFVMSPSSRYNSQGNKTTIINEIGKAEVSATWTRMAWTDGIDGWTVDDEGRKCLFLPAGSTCAFNYNPLTENPRNGKVIEFTYKAKVVADYSLPIITLCDNPNSESFIGIKIKPTNITVHSSFINDPTKDTEHGYNVGDEEVVNVQICLLPNYKITYGNFCIIYVNGVKKCVFSYTNEDSWAVSGGKLIFGNNKTDLYVYSVKVYDKAFEFSNSLMNYYNSLTSQTEKVNQRTKDQGIVNDFQKIDFEMVRDSKEYNYFIVEPLNAQGQVDGDALPRYGKAKSYETKANLEMHYPKNPTWDYWLKGAWFAGQGSTSMNYWDWNLRWRTDKFTSTGRSYDGVNFTTDANKKLSVYIFGQSADSPMNFPIKRITAKRNWASPMQSHKMGTTAAFNDLHDRVVGANEANARTAVLQEPCFGFMRTYDDNGNAVYECIGLFTIGADKGDKTTFGYDGTYKSNLIAMEGTNHNMRLTMFNYPWDSTVEVHNADGTQCIGIKDGNSYYDGWEISNVNNLETDPTKAEFNQSAITSAITTGFKDAYNVAYDNNPHIIGGNISTANADIEAWKARKTASGRSYSELEVWDTSTYILYTLNVSGTRLLSTGKNVLTDLGIAPSTISGKTTEQINTEIINRRIARFRSNMATYWDKEDALFHQMFCLIFGATDNHGKNTYPYRFAVNGGKWRWRQDDLDTIFDIDNQGKANKGTSIEYEDWTSDAKVAYMFKGENSAFWTLLHLAFPSECKEMGTRILDAMYAIGGGSGTYIDGLMSFFKKYYWDKAQDYFPRSAYDIDAERYEDSYPYYTMASGEMKYTVDTNPLEQILGSHIEAERYWVRRRMIYCMSWFKYGNFKQATATDQGIMSFRTQEAQTFKLTPAIDLYPTIGQGENVAPATSDHRVNAGVQWTSTSVGGTNTNVYLLALDWYKDIGDLCGLKTDGAALQIGAKRLQRLKIGDATASKVTAIISELTLNGCPSLEEIDLRNLSTLTGSLDVSQCPRLHKLLLGGTKLAMVNLGNGTKVEVVAYPSTIQVLSLINLKFLTTLTYDNLTALRSLRIESMPSAVVKPLEILTNAYENSTSFSGVRILGLAEDVSQKNVLDIIINLAKNKDKNGNDKAYNGITPEGVSDTSLRPILEGWINLTTKMAITSSDMDLLHDTYPALEIRGLLLVYITFLDKEFERVLIANGVSSDGIGITNEDAAKVTSFGNWFVGNTTLRIVELKYFTKVVDVNLSGTNASVIG